MNHFQQAVLIGVLRDVEGASQLPIPSGYGVAAERLRVMQAREGFAPCSPARWLGGPMSGSDSTLICRAYRDLESLGLLERHALGGRQTQTTHLRLTPAGEAEARRRIAHAPPSYQEVRSGLCDRAAVPEVSADASASGGPVADA